MLKKNTCSMLSSKSESVCEKERVRSHVRALVEVGTRFCENGRPRSEHRDDRPRINVGIR